MPAFHTVLPPLRWGCHLANCPLQIPPSVEALQHPMPPASLLGLCCRTAPPSLPVRVPRSLSPGSGEGAPRSVTFRIPGCRLQTLAQPPGGQGIGLSSHRFECLQGQVPGEGLEAAGLRPCLPGAV